MFQLRIVCTHEDKLISRHVHNNNNTVEGVLLENNDYYIYRYNNVGAMKKQRIRVKETSPQVGVETMQRP